MRFSLQLEDTAGGRIYRVLLAIFGGYAFTAGFFAFFSVLLSLVGVSRVEAMWWSVLTSFLIYTLVAVWAAAATRPLLTTVIIIVSGRHCCRSPYRPAQRPPALVTSEEVVRLLRSHGRAHL